VIILNKHENIKDVLDGLDPIPGEITPSDDMEYDRKSKGLEIKRLEEENNKLRETIVELAVELYSRKNKN
jgi:hypothetical protein